MSEIRKHAKGRWYVCRKADNGVWYIHWSEGGRSRRESTRQKEIGAAQAYFDEFLKLEEAGPSDLLTVGDLFALRYPDPKERYRIAWASLEPTFGALRPQEVTSAIEKAYGRRRGLAPSTLRFELAIVRACINHGVKRRLIDPQSLPVLDPLPDQSPPRTRWLTNDEVNRILAASDPMSRVGRFVRIALNTGARRQAILDLKWDQVDWEADNGRGVIHFLPDGESQTKKRRASVPISEGLRPLLERWHAARTSEHVVGGKRINIAVERLGRRAGVSGLTPHVFRHTAATHMARKGVSLWVIAKVLGNTVEQVEKVYAKYQPDMARAGVEQIGT